MVTIGAGENQPRTATPLHDRAAVMAVTSSGNDVPNAPSVAAMTPEGLCSRSAASRTADIRIVDAPTTTMMPLTMCYVPPNSPTQNASTATHCHTFSAYTLTGYFGTGNLTLHRVHSDISPPLDSHPDVNQRRKIHRQYLVRFKIIVDNKNHRFLE